MKFFCHKCETTHTVTSGQMAVCDVYQEIIAERIPDDLYWCFCCGCQTFWRLNSFQAKERALITACIVCDRSIIKTIPAEKREASGGSPIVSYLCHGCNTISIQTADVAKGASVALSGILSSRFKCPGCRAAIGQARIDHECRFLGLALTTARPECYFCGELLGHKSLAALSSKPAADDPAQRSSSAIYKKKPRQPSRQNLPEAAKEAPALNKAPARPSLETRKNHPNVAVKFVMASLCVACAILIATLAFKPDHAGDVAEAVAAPAPATTAATTPLQPQGMVYIPGGEFWMGSDVGDQYEKPRHRVQVGAFFIDRYEVTCEEYGKFLDATGHRPPPNWNGRSYPPDSARKPVTGVDWHDADSYARWAGKRLPTEIEWEFAARGTEGRLYPWGNEWRADAANADVTSRRKMVDVGTLGDGASPFGVFDLLGNAWEWTASNMQAYPGGSLPAALSQDYKIIRGGSWKDDRSIDARLERLPPARTGYVMTVAHDRSRIANREYDILQLYGTSGETNYPSGLIEVTLFKDVRARPFVSGMLPGIPCQVDYRALDDIAYLNIDEEPSQETGWGRLKLRAFPKKDKKESKFVLKWYAVKEEADAPLASPSSPPPDPQHRSFVDPQNRLNFNYPLNWEEHRMGAIYFAPRGSVSRSGSRVNIDRGMVVSVVKAGSSDLGQASLNVIQALLRANASIQQSEQSREAMLGNRAALVTSFSGRSETTGQVEIVTLYTVMLRKDELLYIAMVRPQIENHLYLGTFGKIIREFLFY